VSAIICFCAALNLMLLLTMPALLGVLVARGVQDVGYALRKYTWPSAYAIVLGIFCILLRWESETTAAWPHVVVPIWLSTLLGAISIAAGATALLRRQAIVQGAIDKRTT